MEGRPRVPDRQALCGILFVPHASAQWAHPSQELGFGSGMTGWRRLAAWNGSGVWGALHLVLPTKLRAPKKLVLQPDFGVCPGQRLERGDSRWMVSGEGRVRLGCPANG
ncbi:transposase [Streptomyces albidoflavus]|uniref:transposase n=1 Tax=Streptomyces albidoflavus TaxID=1886 RepID=UPI003D0B4E0A